MSVIFSDVLFAYLFLWLSSHFLNQGQYWFGAYVDNRDGIISHCSGRWFILYFRYFLFPLLCFPLCLCLPLSALFFVMLSQDPISYACMLKLICKHGQGMDKCQLPILSRNYLPRIFIKMDYFSQETHSSRQKLVLL